jgi:hypothetical protein
MLCGERPDQQQCGAGVDRVAEVDLGRCRLFQGLAMASGVVGHEDVDVSERVYCRCDQCGRCIRIAEVDGLVLGFRPSRPQLRDETIRASHIRAPGLLGVVVRPRLEKYLASTCLRSPTAGTFHPRSTVLESARQRGMGCRGEGGDFGEDAHGIRPPTSPPSITDTATCRTSRCTSTSDDRNAGNAGRCHGCGGNCTCRHRPASGRPEAPSSWVFQQCSTGAPAPSARYNRLW